MTLKGCLRFFVIMGKKLLDRRSAQSKTLYAAFGLRWRLGLRVGEVCNLRLSDLNLDHGSLLVRGKGRKQRRLAVRKGLHRLLEDYLASVRAKFDKGLSDTLFLSCRGRAFRPGCLRKSFRLHASRAGIAATPHALPHSFATKAARSGVNAVCLQKLLGHSSITTTESYSHNSLQDLEGELDKLQFERH